MKSAKYSGACGQAKPCPTTEPECYNEPERITLLRLIELLDSRLSRVERAFPRQLGVDLVD